MKKTEGKSKIVRYNKWGSIFLIPFVLVYVIFQLIPLVSTIYNSFFENYRVGLMQVGPTWGPYRCICANSNNLEF